MIKQSLRGVKELTAFLSKLPRGVKITAMRAIATYLIGNERRGLKHEPKRVKHGADNPYQWQSENQRKAYFASNGFGGGIPYKRTGKLSDGWIPTEKDANWTSVSLENKYKYADFVMGDSQQRGHNADGWRKVLDVINTNIKGAIQAGQRAVNDFISKS